jgi:uncharacterized protein YjaZ
MMPNIDSPKLIHDAQNLYGKEQADKILADIFEWHELASMELHMDASAQALNVELGAPQGVSSFFKPKDQSITINLPPQLPEDMSTPIAVALVHENTHRKRNGFYVQTNAHDDYDIFSAFIDEGLAVCAEAEILETEPDPLFTFVEEEEQDLPYIDGLLLDILFYTKLDNDSPDRKIRRYLFGTSERTAMRAYRVGHLIVAKAMLLSSLSILEACELPDSFFREFAEEYL